MSATITGRQRNLVKEDLMHLMHAAPAFRINYLAALVGSIVFLVLICTSGAAGAQTAWTLPVPKAECGPNDRVETGLQGETTPGDRISGRSELGYNCNLELVGQHQG